MLVNLNDMLTKAQKGGYAVGLFNTTDTDMLEAALDAAAELAAPIIIGTAEILLPYGELRLIAPSVVAAAERAPVPVAVHYDHGLTFERCVEALRLGFSSVMYDGSAKAYETNVRETREIVRIARAFGATVEGEIGRVGNADEDPDGAYTTAEEAKAFAAATGVDALAVSIGTAHGAYRSAPKLDLTRLKEIRAAVSVPLVLHGGSGLSDDDFRQAIAAGIAKVNIFTDLCLAGERAARAAASDSVGYLQARNRKVAAIREAVKTKMLLFGCRDKA